MFDLFGLGDIASTLMAVGAALLALFGVYKMGGSAQKKKQKIEDLKERTRIIKGAEEARENVEAIGDDPVAIDERLREHGAFRD